MSHVEDGFVVRLVVVKHPDAFPASEQGGIMLGHPSYTGMLMTIKHKSDDC